MLVKLTPKATWKLAMLVLAVTAVSAVIGIVGAGTLQGESRQSEKISGQSAQHTLQTPADRVALGKMLFFDPRLSGDGSTSCATCHKPENAWTDGLPLSAGYSRGNLYFRNTPTLLNATRMPLYDWDGRFSEGDVSSLIRDHIAEAHFMNLDGRLLIERMRQVPEYEEAFQDLWGSDVSYGKVLGAVQEYIETLVSQDNPYLDFIGGDTSALSGQAQAGLKLFNGKAGCVQCHSGELLSDGGLHALGVPGNDDIFQKPERHITFRRFFRGFGIGEFATMTDDPGLFALTHEEDDRGRFRTPSLLEAARTAPYMHNGSLATIQDVVEFYNQGGGDSPNKDPLLAPLGLTTSEVSDLVAFLESLGSPDKPVDAPTLPEYKLRTLGAN